MRNHTASPYIGSAAQLQRVFQRRPELPGGVQKLQQIAATDNFKRNISSTATNFLPFAMGDSFA